MKTTTTRPAAELWLQPTVEIPWPQRDRRGRRGNGDYHPRPDGLHPAFRLHVQAWRAGCNGPAIRKPGPSESTGGSRH